MTTTVSSLASTSAAGGLGSSSMTSTTPVTASADLALYPVETAQHVAVGIFGGLSAILQAITGEGPGDVQGLALVGSVRCARADFRESLSSLQKVLTPLQFGESENATLYGSFTLGLVLLGLHLCSTVGYYIYRKFNPPPLSSLRAQQGAGVSHSATIALQLPQSSSSSSSESSSTHSSDEDLSSSDDEGRRGNKRLSKSARKARQKQLKKARRKNAKVNAKLAQLSASFMWFPSVSYACLLFLFQGLIYETGLAYVDARNNSLAMAMVCGGFTLLMTVLLGVFGLKRFRGGFHRYKKTDFAKDRSKINLFLYPAGFWYPPSYMQQYHHVYGAFLTKKRIWFPSILWLKMAVLGSTAAMQSLNGSSCEVQFGLLTAISATFAVATAILRPHRTLWVSVHSTIMNVLVAFVSLMGYFNYEAMPKTMIGISLFSFLGAALSLVMNIYEWKVWKPVEGIPQGWPKRSKGEKGSKTKGFSKYNDRRQEGESSAEAKRRVGFLDNFGAGERSSSSSSGEESLSDRDEGSSALKVPVALHHQFPSTSLSNPLLESRVGKKAHKSSASPPALGSMSSIMSNYKDDLANSKKKRR